MKLSIIIPVFNEKNTITAVVRVVKNVALEKEIIIVDDASTDGSVEILKVISREPGIKVLYHEKNMGKGSAIKTALPHITGDLVIIQDSDLEYDPNEYPELIEPIIENKADVVYGSRFLKPNKRIYLRFYLGNKLLSFCISMLFGKKITDSYTCYKLFKTEIFKGLKLTSSGFEMEAEITSKLLKSRYRLVEIPINYHPRSIKEGKKICWKDAVKGLFSMLKYRFTK